MQGEGNRAPSRASISLVNRNQSGTYKALRKSMSLTKRILHIKIRRIAVHIKPAQANKAAHWKLLYTAKYT